jgi:hypothetical protein
VDGVISIGLERLERVFVETGSNEARETLEVGSGGIFEDPACVGVAEEGAEVGLVEGWADALASGSFVVTACGAEDEIKIDPVVVVEVSLEIDVFVGVAVGVPFLKVVKVVNSSDFEVEVLASDKVVLLKGNVVDLSPLSDASVVTDPLDERFS